MPDVVKVVFNGETLIDHSDATVDADKVLKNYIAYEGDGDRIVGALSNEAAEIRDVNFFDYDGTCVYSYTKAEWANVTELPANPSHSGLTSQGWNWTKAQIDSQLASCSKQYVNVGQMYITDDKKTRLYCEFSKVCLSPYLVIYLNGTAVVDWGDDSQTDTLTGSSLTTPTSVQHTYSSSGNYVITISVTSGTFSIIGSQIDSITQKGIILRSVVDGNVTESYIYANTIKKVELGESVTLGNYAFSNAYTLKSVTIPKDTSFSGNAQFNYCYSLKSITIPSNVTSIGELVFQNNGSIESIILPGGMTSIGKQSFSFIYSLSTVTIPNGVTGIPQSLCSMDRSFSVITIPSNVTSIEASAFSGNYSLKEVHLLRTTPPTLANTNAFNNIASDCVMYVPRSENQTVLNAYQTASNWSTYSSKMQEEPQGE